MDREGFTFAVTCGLLMSAAGIVYELVFQRDIVLAAIFVLMGLSFLLYYLGGRKRYQS